jgi:hypothetical protein
MARFRQFTKRQLWQRFLVQKVPTFYTIVNIFSDLENGSKDVAVENTSGNCFFIQL